MLKSLPESVLESILSAEACKGNLPTIDSLLEHPFFSSIVLTLKPTDKAVLKISTSTKEHLKTAVTQIEDRLKEEQKMVRSQKRLVRVQEMMSSEEEKKKQRHKLVNLIPYFIFFAVPFNNDILHCLIFFILFYIYFYIIVHNFLYYSTYIFNIILHIFFILLLFLFL